MKICNLDFETGSRADLTKVGVYNYVTHPSTRVHILKYTFNRGRRFHTWHVARGDPLPADLDAALDDAEVMFEGWNVAFERLVLRDVLDIEIPIHRFRCTMARARAMALPASLELCGRALQTDIQKADDSAMKLWMKPLPDGSWATPASHPVSYDDLARYCQIDVITEIEIGDRLRELSEEEWVDYWINEMVNDRGLPVDVELAEAAQSYAEAEMEAIAGKLDAMTDSQVTSPKQFARIKQWLNARLPVELQLVPDDENGKVPSFDRSAREEMMSADNDSLLPAEAREFIQLIHDGGRASTAKFAAMQARAGADGRVRGAYVFNGAGQTHRFSSNGLQVHNFVRARLPDPEPVIAALLRKAPVKEVLGLTGDKSLDIMTVLSRCLRPAIIAEPGKMLVWGDWEQIEARILPWLSGEKESAAELLDVFRRGEDVYRRQAALTYSIDIDQVTKEQRQNGGKIPVLSFGFGGGVGAIFNMARAYGVRVTEEEAQKLKHAWRLSNPWAPLFWDALERAALDAVNDPGEHYPAGRVTYCSTGDVLWACLPSGRTLAYPFPLVEEIETPFGIQAAVTCMKGSFRPKKNEKNWPRMRLWGGIQAENVTQAEAASVLRYAVRELVRNEWPVIGHTHDEPLLEVDEDEVDEAKAALHDIMTSVPACYAGLPLAAEVSSGVAYGK